MGAHIPERFAPGVFDIVGYGHQLFHLCIDMVSWNLLDAANIDCSASEGHPGNWRNILIVFAFLFSIGAIILNVRLMMAKARTKTYDHESDYVEKKCH
ncbi:unnamed protein product [Caenorhabditis angaria]|uniref:Uncharacterized protein n=1 Tax=Caenorhabditis angaria TaxID=860376 RepID=A0A9P1IYV8_9PELO|nr:unnamed protein product [Caenorhabditis angaria]